MVTKEAPSETGVTVLLTQLTRQIYRRTPEELLGMRLKPYATLVHLNEHRGVSQQELGEILCVDANNLVLLLNELEAAGYALRRRDPADRRRHLVDITPEGEQALARADAGLASVEDEVLGTLSGEERATLRRLLGKAIEGATVGARH